MTQPDFNRIRPYSDDEVAGVVGAWAASPRLRRMVQRTGASALFRVPVLGPLLVRGWLKSRLGAVNSIDSLQHAIAPWVERLFDSTTDQVTSEGLEHLSPDNPCLFLSNHRDIVTDPAVVNYLLYRQGFGTTRIAIGDNLTEDPLVSDLMRLNKSFIVRRSLKSPREMRDVYLTLSAYIRESLESGESVWLAQREGRAKDGIDVTDPAIIKMLYMSFKRDKTALPDAMDRLRLVPVAVSYEVDPCDMEKARELEARARTGEYRKQPGEDIASIVRGITGYKGRIHVAFGQPLHGDFSSPAAVAEAVDEQILKLYRFFPINYAAAEQLVSRGALPRIPAGAVEKMPDKSEMDKAHAWLDRRLPSEAPELHLYILGIYANPLLRAFGVDGITIENKRDNHD